MLSRHEEKYIITYRQYAELLRRARGLLTPDSHGDGGTYTITSIYYDDPENTGLYEKLDGLKLHSKFRVRTYDYDTRFVRLERKDKLGILTNKISAVIGWEQVPLLAEPGIWEQTNGTARELLQQMQSKTQKPVVAVRYTRDAFYHEGSDFRLTFDRDLEALPPDALALSDPGFRGIPVLGAGQVVMEVKYGTYLPAFARKLTRVKAQQLSLSKYALCRVKF
ncbi:MAG: polyphosphate polymerase domain-containing protein [Oscillospiraceae bacterium]|nr:polyphosphate polymerase domain-containing protein [Oscillospiraceae bacterium]